jgi:DNA polymerase-1
LKIPRAQAQTFIDKYFEIYPGVKEYFDNVLKEAKKHPFIETLMGRRKSTAGLEVANY